MQTANYTEKEHHMQINRLFEIVYLLLEKKQITAKELAEHFEVSTRTIYRDVETLSGAGIPIYMTKGKGGGISLLPEFVLNKTVITEAERADILSSLHAMHAVDLQEAGTALNKLGAMFGRANVDWIEVDFGFWGDGEKEAGYFELLKKAIFEKRVTQFQYAATGSEQKLRTVEPLKLVFKGSNWYLYAYCRMREEYRFFKLKRMQDVSVTEEKFMRQTPQKVLQNENIYASQPKVKVTLKLGSRVAYRAMDDFPECEILADRSARVSGEFIQGDWLVDTLLGYGEHCEVIEPVWLREAVQEKLRRLVEKYALR